MGYEPRSRAHARDSFIYGISMPVAAALIIATTLSATHRMWWFLAASSVLLAATCVTAWRALMRMSKQAPPARAGEREARPDRAAGYFALAALALAGGLAVIYLVLPALTSHP